MIAWLITVAAIGQSSLAASAEHNSGNREQNEYSSVLVQLHSSTVTTTVVDGPPSLPVDDAPSTASCGPGLWVQKCESVEPDAGDGVSVASDGSSCTAWAASDEVSVTARATCSCSQTIGSVSDSIFLDNQTVSASCASGDAPLSCTCETRWGAQLLCPSGTSFTPVGNSCSMSIPVSSPRRRRGVEAGTGSKIYAICDAGAGTCPTTTTTTTTMMTTTRPRLYPRPRSRPRLRLHPIQYPHLHRHHGYYGAKQYGDSNYDNYGKRYKYRYSLQHGTGQFDYAKDRHAGTYGAGNYYQHRRQVRYSSQSGIGQIDYAKDGHHGYNRAGAYGEKAKYSSQNGIGQYDYTKDRHHGYFEAGEDSHVRYDDYGKEDKYSSQHGPARYSAQHGPARWNYAGYYREGKYGYYDYYERKNKFSAQHGPAERWNYAKDKTHDRYGYYGVAN